MGIIGTEFRDIGILVCLCFGPLLLTDRHLRSALVPSIAIVEPTVKSEPVVVAVAARRKKYAIAFGWFFAGQEPPRSTEAIAQMLCPAVLSMTLGVKQAQIAMAKQHVPATPIDKLMVTNLRTLPSEMRKFMESRGVRVIGVDDDPLISKARERFEGTQLVNVLKLVAMTHPDWGYAAIQLADWDLFMLSPLDLLTPAALRGMIFVRHGSMTPTNGGLLVMRPSAQLGDSLVRALEHGFSYRDGWGGNYSRRDLLLAKPWVDVFCKNTGARCCRSVPRSVWCFGAAEVDQGLLFHLVIDGGRKSTCYPFGNECKFTPHHLLHITLSPKPWQVEQAWYLEKHGQLKQPRKRLETWWERVGPLAKQIFREDKSCGALFDRQRELFRQWQRGQ